MRSLDKVGSPMRCLVLAAAVLAVAGRPAPAPAPAPVPSTSSEALKSFFDGVIDTDSWATFSFVAQRGTYDADTSTLTLKGVAPIIPVVISGLTYEGKIVRNSLLKPSAMTAPEATKSGRWLGGAKGWLGNINDESMFVDMQTPPKWDNATSTATFTGVRAQAKSGAGAPTTTYANPVLILQAASKGRVTWSFAGSAP